ncbi:hypothetical protein V6N11_036689 [Hibiscus sabdariffa]|uniref:Uncharacterized protein n=1 Tax=Hibiscus sabdariffa TaxID=183260 RepID=A0ABR2RBH1_9ROSI
MELVVGCGGEDDVDERRESVRRTLTDHSFNLTSSSSFSVEFHRKVSQSSMTQNDRDGSGFELNGVADVDSIGFWNEIDFGGTGILDEGVDEMMKVVL